MKTLVTYSLLSFLFFASSTVAFSQKKKNSDANNTKSNVSKEVQEISISENYQNTTRAIQNRSDVETAVGYITLADKFLSNGDYTNAEKYLILARNTLVNDNSSQAKKLLAKTNNKIDQIRTLQKSRITTQQKAQEDQNKFYLKQKDEQLRSEATQPYPQNDSIEEIKLRRDIQGKEKNLNAEEKISAYTTLLSNRLENDDAETAKEDFKKVIKDKSVVGQESQLAELNQTISENLVSQGKIKEAIDLKRDFLNSPALENNSRIKAQEEQQLADLLIENNDEEEAEKVLRESLKISLANHHSIEAMQAMKQLQELYRKQGKSALLLPEYIQFVDLLPSLLNADSALLENRVLEVTGDRILALQNETHYKDQLLAKQKLLGLFLIGGLCIAALLIFFILRSLQTIKRNNKQIHLQSLRREMNPHFIFNSLNSVNQFISNRDELEANKYLSSFSKLMRDFMENSTSDFIKIDKEIAQLDRYIQLEHKRFRDVFDYEYNVDEALRDENISIPNMLIQPFIENAVWHGLRYRKEKGRLSLSLRKLENKVEVIVEDNGIGLKESALVKTKHQKQNKGRAVSNIHERIELLNSLYDINIQLQQQEKSSPDSGVIIKLMLPILYK